MEQFFQQVANGLSVGSTYAVVALGFGLTFSVMRVINLAHPELFMLGAYLTGVVVTFLGYSSASAPLAGAVGMLILVLILVMGGTGATGLVVERFVIRPVRGRYILIPFMATGGIAIFMQYAAQRVWGSDPAFVPSIIPFHAFWVWGVNITAAQLTTFIAGVIVMFLLRYYVRETRWGRATRAVAERADVAAACGVNVNFVSQLTVGISSMMAGIAGVTIGLLYTSAWPFMGLLYGLKAFVCMLVGGNRHIEAIMAIGLVLGIIEAMVTGYLTSTLRDAVAFSMLLGILVFRPNGLFGSYDV